MQIPFNKPYLGGKELWYIAQAHTKGHMAGDGSFTKQCQRWLEQRTGCRKALLTHSCTAALEMAAILADIKPGDEVIMPSYTFVSTANAFVLRGAVPVFVDIRPDTLNIDETQDRGGDHAAHRAIVPVHYAGVGCEMDAIMAIAERHRLLVIEDAAQAILSNYQGPAARIDRPLGNAELSRNEEHHLRRGRRAADQRPGACERAEIIREKGTNRSQFFRGQVDKYTWVDIGSSYLPGEIIAAFLWAQMEEADYISARRMSIWKRYHAAFESLENEVPVHRPVVADERAHNAHMYYLLLSDLQDRTAFIEAMKQAEIHCVFHYVPLHTAPYGRLSGRAAGPLPVTTDVADRLVRLPLWLGLEEHLDHVISVLIGYLKHRKRR